VCINGVSLTINAASAGGQDSVTFDVMLVPHTLRRTLLGDEGPGAHVNIEVDVLARYVARQLEGKHSPATHAAASERGEDHGTDVDDDQRILAKLRSGGFL
jgi:riboflavin synthase